MEITQLLQRVHHGDQEALDTVIPLVYAELKKLAAGRARTPARNHGLGSRDFPAIGRRPASLI
jgi:hypothetical protein